MRLDVPRDHRAGTHHGPLPDCDATEEGGVAPIDAPRRTSVGSNSHRSPDARGYRSFVNTAEGPTNTSSSSVTPE